MVWDINENSKVWTVYTQLKNRAGAITDRTYHIISDTEPKPMAWWSLQIIRYYVKQGSYTEEDMIRELKETA